MPPRRRWRSWVTRLATLAASLTFTAVAGELLLRSVDPLASWRGPTNPTFPWVDYDPVVGRINRPGHTDETFGFRINALGMRGDDVDVAKPPGFTRIACLGDSTTFGIFKHSHFEMRTTAAYADRLAERLRAAGYDRTEVLNAGTLGATSASALAFYLVRLRPLDVDVLIVRVGNNDHTQLRGSAAMLATDAEYRAMRLLPPSAAHSETVRVGFHAYRRWLAAQPWAVRGEQVPLPRYEANLRRLAETAHAAGTRVLFLDFPYRELARGPSPGETFPNYFLTVRSLAELHELHAQYQTATERIAGETGAAYLRTVNALRASPVPVFTDFDLSHPNEAGAEILGRGIFEELQRRGWLQGR